MERLTELKVGQELPVDVLIAWVKKLLKHYGTTNWAGSSNNVFSTAEKYRYIESIGVYSQANSFTVRAPGCLATIVKSEGFIEFYNQFYNLGTKPINLKKRSIFLEDVDHSIKVQQRLFDLGYSWVSSKKTIQTGGNFVDQWIYIDSCGNLLITARGQVYPLITKEDLFGSQTINTINTINIPLNNKTDGKSIIVCSPVTTITGGKRPEGTSISGKKSTTAIGVGHLSYRAINS